jgi:hypothetical protein
MSERRLLEKILKIDEQIRDILLDLVALLGESSQATSATLSLGGSTMANTLVTLDFVDSAGLSAAAPTGDGSGLVVTFETTDDTVATVGSATEGTDASGNVNYSAPIDEVGAPGAAYTISAIVANVSGAALLDDDGVTAFVQPTGVSGTVSGTTADQATTATLTLS